MYRAISALTVLVTLLFTGGGCQEEPAAMPAPPVRAEGGILQDLAGRQVILRGINARVDGIFDVTFDDGRVPLEKIPPLSGEDCRFIGAELGFNLLRLPVNWSGIEPKKGQYSEAYFARVEQVIRRCHAHGVYTLIDLHQDAWSKEIGEDGAPLWAIVPPPTKLLQGPLKDLEQRRMSAQVLAAFKSFFEDAAGLQQAYADMAGALMRRMRAVPGVVGLELMNEPVLFSGNSQLDAFHAELGRSLRRSLPELSLYFEPNSMRNQTDEMAVSTPFPLKNGVYAPHIYTGVFLGNWKSGDVARIRKSVQAAQKEATAHGAALLVSEFGHDPKTALGREWLTATLAELDAVRASWALWLYEEYSQGSWGLYEAGPNHTRGKLRSDYAKIIARPFPAALAGRLISSSWDAASRTLTVKFDRARTGEHLVTAPRLAYPAGPRIRCGGAPVTARKVQPGRFAFSCQGGSFTVSP